jgi:hypothetical protein
MSRARVFEVRDVGFLRFCSITNQNQNIKRSPQAGKTNARLRSKPCGWLSAGRCRNCCVHANQYQGFNLDEVVQGEIHETGKVKTQAECLIIWPLYQARMTYLRQMIQTKILAVSVLSKPEGNKELQDVQRDKSMKPNANGINSEELTGYCITILNTILSVEIATKEQKWPENI